MTFISDAQAALVTARNRLGTAFLAEVDEDDQQTIGLAMIHVRDALDVLERVEPQQQTGGGANLSLAGDSNDG